MKKDSVGFDAFSALDIRVGTIIKADEFVAARKPAFKLWVDFGEEVGILKSSAQITAFYTLENLKGLQVMGIVNFEPKQIGNFMSEFLLLGIYHGEGVVLVTPNMPCKNGEKLG